MAQNTLKLRIKPKAAQKVLQEIALLSKRRPGSISSTPGFNDHALFLRLINSQTLRKEWLNSFSKENSFNQFRVIADIQKMGYKNFKKWLEDQSKKTDVSDPNDPANQQFFNRQFAMQQGAIITSEEDQKENEERREEVQEFSREEAMEHLLVVIEGSDWIQEASEGQDAEHTTDNRSRLISNLTASLKGVESEAEASSNPEVQQASSEIFAFMREEAGLGSESSFIPRPKPPMEEED